MDGLSVLDHGFVRYVEHCGSDESIISAARMSTGKGFLGWGPTHASTCVLAGKSYLLDNFDGFWCYQQCVPNSGDEKLLAYLWKHKHATPFEMATLVIEVKAPIFVFREWHRHRTQSYNEMSARYTPLPNENYVPSVNRLMVGASGNKQATTMTGARTLTNCDAEIFREQLRSIYEDAQRVYEDALAAGVPKELARVHLPVGRYSVMRASANLRNWLAFLTLRMDPAAQWEIRRYANAVGEIISKLFPRTWELFAQ